MSRDIGPGRLTLEMTVTRTSGNEIVILDKVGMVIIPSALDFILTLIIIVVSLLAATLLAVEDMICFKLLPL